MIYSSFQTNKKLKFNFLIYKKKNITELEIIIIII